MSHSTDSNRKFSCSFCLATDQEAQEGALPAGWHCFEDGEGGFWYGCQEMPNCSDKLIEQGDLNDS